MNFSWNPNQFKKPELLLNLLHIQPCFTFESDYQTSFDPYLAPPQTDSMQDYFGYIAQSMYQMNLNQQVFQNRVNNEFANINNEISILKGNLIGLAT
jgi:hypothetical protein